MRVFQLVAPLALVATPAAAQTAFSADDASASRAVVFEGTAAPMCVIQTPTASNAQNASLVSPQSGGATIALTAGGFVDGQTGIARSSGIELALPITCNGPHHLRVASGRGALLLDGAAADSAQFSSRLDFLVDIGWAGRQETLDTTRTRSLDMPVSSAATGAASIRLRIPGGGQPLVAGSYSDYLTIVVETDS